MGLIYAKRFLADSHRAGAAAIGVLLFLCGACHSDQTTIGPVAIHREAVAATTVLMAQAKPGRAGIESATGHEPLGANWFVQYPWGRRGAQAKRYERIVMSEGRLEGSLIGRVDFPLDQYLDPHSERRPRPAVNWPATGGRHLDAFFMEFKPPLPEWPTGARPGETVRALAEVVAYERDGTPFATGTVRRTMRLAGFEILRVGDQVFEEAARMEAQSELTFGWLATIRVSETAWFVRGVGLVRRDEHYSGRALWLFRFGGASEYEREDPREARMEMVAERLDGAARATSPAEREMVDEGIVDDHLARPSVWSHLAICFERSGRRLQISGVAVDWATQE